MVDIILHSPFYGVFVFFFFFKQKTAYEMRISDWSSDVCSSDLHRAGDRHGIFQQTPNETTLCRKPFAHHAESGDHQVELFRGHLVGRIDRGADGVGKRLDRSLQLEIDTGNHQSTSSSVSRICSAMGCVIMASHATTTS